MYLGIETAVKLKLLTLLREKNKLIQKSQKNAAEPVRRLEPICAAPNRFQSRWTVSAAFFRKKPPKKIK